MMVSQGGTGSGISGPSVAELYKTLFGIKGSHVDLAAAAPPGGHPTTALPTVREDGTVAQPAADVRPSLDEPNHTRASRTADSASVLPPFRREDQQ
jgi:hypothetical protein